MHTTTANRKITVFASRSVRVRFESVFGLPPPRNLPSPWKYVTTNTPKKADSRNNATMREVRRSCST